MVEIKHIPFTCTFNCGCRCELLVHIKDDEIMRIDTPANRTDSTRTPRLIPCVKGRARRRSLYAPERIKTPLKRVGPPCADVCPTGAISKKDDGFVHLDVESCNNCGMCKDVCPFNSIIELPEGFHSKCDGCYDEVTNGWDPTCVRACPIRALSFKPIEEVDLATHRIEKDFRDCRIGPSVIYLRNKLNDKMR